MRVTPKPALTYPASWLSQVRVTRGSTAHRLDRADAADGLDQEGLVVGAAGELSFSRLRSTGVMPAEINAYTGSDSTTSA